MAKSIAIIAVILGAGLAIAFILAALFAYGFNVMGNGLGWPVIGWEEGFGALIMLSISGVFVGGSSSAASR